MRRLIAFLAMLLTLAASLSPIAAAGDGPDAVASATPAYDYGQFLDGESAAKVAEPSTVVVLLDMAWKLGLVLALAYGVLWLMKRLMRVKSVSGGGQVLVIETVGLGANRTLHLLRVGSRTLLVGATTQQLCTLADVTDAMAPAEARAWQEADECAGVVVEEADLERADPDLLPAYAAFRSIRRLWGGRQP